MGGDTERRTMVDAMFYCGRPIDEMTREELIEALRTMGILYRQATESHMQAWDSLRSLRSELWGSRNG